MKNNTVLVSSTFVFTTILLYLIGHLYHIKWLMLSIDRQSASGDIVSSAGGSALPVIVGVIMAIIVDKFLKTKLKT